MNLLGAKLRSSEGITNSRSDLGALRHLSLEGAAATAASQGVKLVLQVVAQVWLAHLISPAESGLVAMVAPILAFIGIISDLGIGTAIVQQKSIKQSQISALFWLNAIASLLICLGLVALSPLVGKLYREPKTVAITIALAALFFVGTLGIHPSAILTREMRLGRRAVIECVQSALGLAVGVLTARAGCGYWSLVYLQGASTVSGVLLTWWSAQWRPSPIRWDRSAGQIMRFGANLTISNIAMYMSVSADNMIVGAVKGKVALGLYDKAYRLVLQPLSQLSAPIGRVAIPLLSRLHDQPEQYASAFRRMVQLPMLICVPMLLCGIFFSPQIVGIFLGPLWTGIAPVFSWVCVGGLVSGIYGSATWLFTSQGRGRDQMTWAIITSAISVASFLVGIKWGAVGVAATGAAGFVVLQTPLIIWAATRTGPVSARFLIRAIAPISISLLTTAPVVYLYSRLSHLGTVEKLCGGVLLTHTVYLAIIFITPAGREMISGIMRLISSYLNRFRVIPQREPA